MKRKSGFTLIEVIVVIVIMSIISSIRFNSNFKLLDILETKEDLKKLEPFQDSIIKLYNDKGIYRSSSDDLSPYLQYGLKDRFGNPIEILQNSDGSLFKLEGDTVDTYKMAIVLRGNDRELNSGISSINNEFIPVNEDYVLLTDEMFKNGDRYKVINQLNICKSRLDTYISVNGGNPTSMNDLISGNYIEPKYTIDLYGNKIHLDLTNVDCYSYGYDRVDNSRSGDDVLIN